MQTTNMCCCCGCHKWSTRSGGTQGAERLLGGVYSSVSGFESFWESTQKSPTRCLISCPSHLPLFVPVGVTLPWSPHCCRVPPSGMCPGAVPVSTAAVCSCHSNAATTYTHPAILTCSKNSKTFQILDKTGLLTKFWTSFCALLVSLGPSFCLTASRLIARGPGPSFCFFTGITDRNYERVSFWLGFRARNIWRQVMFEILM